MRTGRYLSQAITSMCDIQDTLQSSLVFWTLSFIPTKLFRYIALGIASISLVIYSVYRNRPSVTLRKLNAAIIIADGILARAKTRCMRDHLSLAEIETRLLRIYLQNIITISRNLAISERELRDIRRSLLLLLEAAYQRRLAEDINGSRYQEIENRPPPSPHSCRARVHHHDVATDYEV
ncbi:hypothetical protein B0H14DRAFT_2705420 [Mycena olivaceomarginata]|nr:hypothetical protein B0H14DRAFT_2705420 [Mycena olivaceomarginata]